MSWLLWIYLAGVVLGVLMVDGSLPARIVLAVLWPLGILAFVSTIAALILVAAIAFPLFGLLLALALAAALFLF